MSLVYNCFIIGCTEILWTPPMTSSKYNSIILDCGEILLIPLTSVKYTYVKMQLYFDNNRRYSLNFSATYNDNIVLWWCHWRYSLNFSATYNDNIVLWWHQWQYSLNFSTTYNDTIVVWWCQWQYSLNLQLLGCAEI